MEYKQAEPGNIYESDCTGCIQEYLDAILGAAGCVFVTFSGQEGEETSFSCMGTHPAMMTLIDALVNYVDAVEPC